MNNEKLITVHTFSLAPDASIIRGRLESEGIACFVQNELISQVAPFYSSAFGGIKLQVKESDAPRAIEILEEAGYIREEDKQPTKFDSWLSKKIGKLSRK
jgi:hypothetical protein